MRPGYFNSDIVIRRYLLTGHRTTIIYSNGIVYFVLNSSSSPLTACSISPLKRFTVTLTSVA